MKNFHLDLLTRMMLSWKSDGRRLFTHSFIHLNIFCPRVSFCLLHVLDLLHYLTLSSVTVLFYLVCLCFHGGVVQCCYTGGPAGSRVVVVKNDKTFSHKMLLVSFCCAVSCRTAHLMSDAVLILVTFVVSTFSDRISSFRTCSIFKQTF